MHVGKFIALVVLFLCGELPEILSVTNFKRVRQELEVDSTGITHVFIRVLDYNSSFELLLRKNEDNVFSDDHVLSVGGKEMQLQPDFMYSGGVNGHPVSHASGSIHDEAFEGSVELNPDQRYFIESGKRLFGKDFCHDDFRFCYVIYNTDENHDHSEHRSKRAVGDHGLGMCGWHSQRVRDALLPMLNSGYSHVPAPIFDESQRRIRRDAQAISSSPVKICNLFMQTDPKLWDLYLGDYNGDTKKTHAQIVKLIAQIVQGVNEIYAKSTFVDGALGPYSNIQLKIVRTAIYDTSSTCNGKSTDTVAAQLCRDNIDSAEFLNINSMKNHDKYCLAYLMTHRQFSEGVQGLAWVGYPKSYAGGICQRNTYIGGKQASYNTGIFTSNNYGKRSSMSSLILTMAHEVGHNFGSAHDNTPECEPGGSQGNYLMYPYVLSGDRPNNKKFSPCSNVAITANLGAIFNQRSKYNCFTQDSTPFCGNGIVEAGESCDCGFSEDCALAGDTCCVPADQSRGCSLKSGATCSPSNGICCDPSTCSLYSSTVAPTIECRPADECSLVALCNSSSATCPTSTSKPDGTLCWENSRVCKAGECSQSLCSLVKDAASQGYESCQEDIPDGERNFERYCYMACKPSSGTQCLNSAYIKSASDDSPFFSFLTSFNNGSVKGIQLGAGSPCNNFKGFCDVFHKCRQVNSQGPLASLFALLSGDQAPQTVAQWLVTYWYVVAIVAVFFVAVVLILTQIFARNCLPSSNPKKHGRRSLKESCKRTLCPCVKNSSVNNTS